jgi:hypothetical protein
MDDLFYKYIGKYKICQDKITQRTRVLLNSLADDPSKWKKLNLNSLIKPRDKPKILSTKDFNLDFFPILGILKDNYMLFDNKYNLDCEIQEKEKQYICEARCDRHVLDAHKRPKLIVSEWDILRTFDTLYGLAKVVSEEDALVQYVGSHRNEALNDLFSSESEELSNSKIILKKNKIWLSKISKRFKKFKKSHLSIETFDNEINSTTVLSVPAEVTLELINENKVYSFPSSIRLEKEISKIEQQHSNNDLSSAGFKEALERIHDPLKYDYRTTKLITFRNQLGEMGDIFEIAKRITLDIHPEEENGLIQTLEADGKMPTHESADGICVNLENTEQFKKTNLTKELIRLCQEQGKLTKRESDNLISYCDKNCFYKNEMFYILSDSVALALSHFPKPDTSEKVPLYYSLNRLKVREKVIAPDIE